ncbi:hypothetical protein DIS24_g10106 [Lasiodiplodia hormozganensis]|uniref:Cell wall mannoprotein 1 n=1 Tax=Lasiodiplodia hormozganensis TaxID=869390 RepID=A0AA39XQ46_9PEZI|nr:hypothetical protein DIS24_g10106 [Lasiodiplodia hormozganensis]
MHFFAKLVTVLPAVAGVASAAVIPRDVDSDTMIAQLKDLTDRSQAIDAQTQTVTPVNSFQVFPAITQSLSDLIRATSGDATAAANTQPFADEATQQSVCDAFDTFVKAQQAMLATLIGKADLASQTGFAYPIAAALRGLEGSDDTYLFELLDTVPSCKTDATEDKNNLDKSLDQAVTTYSNPGF